MRKKPETQAPLPHDESTLQVGDEFVVTVGRLNDDGEGVAKAPTGMTLFVTDLLPEETAKVIVSQVEKRYARARVVARQGTSPLREQPVCSVFGECGGCQLQHLTYAAQLEHKQRMVEHILHRFLQLPDARVLPTLGMRHPYRYRNQVQVALHYDDRAQRYVSGFFAPGSHELVHTQYCHLEPVEMEKTVLRVLEVLNEAAVSVGLGVHHLVVRESFTNGEQMVVLAMRQPLKANSDIVRQVGHLPHVVSVGQTLQPNPHGPVWGATVELLHGVPHLRERIGGLEFLISPRSFFQVNTQQAATLYDQVLASADITPEDVVLDAYCGTGTISLLLAAKAGRVVGVESIRAAVEDARFNAGHNRMANAEFIVGEVERVLPKRLGTGEKYDVVVLDPPRKGCHPDVLKAVISAHPRRIVYVSCNHATLARDLRALLDGGYKLLMAQPVDMFPQTGHVETCVSLIRSS